MELVHRRIQDFTMQRVHEVGAGSGGLGARKSPVRSRGTDQAGGPGTTSPRSWSKMWN